MFLILPALSVFVADAYAAIIHAISTLNHLQNVPIVHVKKSG